MGRQIYKTFRHSEVTKVNVMMPNTVYIYELKMWENLVKFQAVFEDLTTKNALVIVSTITSSDRLGITFQFDTKRIISIEQLHELSIPGRISNSRLSAVQRSAVQGSTDEPED